MKNWYTRGKKVWIASDFTLTYLCLNLYPFIFQTLLLNFHLGSSQKKLLAPDMFTESDDMFAAYFDVSNFTYITLNEMYVNNI